MDAEVLALNARCFGQVGFRHWHPGFHLCLRIYLASLPRLPLSRLRCIPCIFTYFFSIAGRSVRAAIPRYVDCALTEMKSLRGLHFAKADAWRQLSVYPRQVGGGWLSFVVVPDMQTTGACDDTTRDVEAVYHVARPFNFTLKENEADVLMPTRERALSALDSAMKAKNIPRVVLPVGG